MLRLLSALALALFCLGALEAGDGKPRKGIPGTITKVSKDQVTIKLAPKKDVEGKTVTYTLKHVTVRLPDGKTTKDVKEVRKALMNGKRVLVAIIENDGPPEKQKVAITFGKRKK